MPSVKRKLVKTGVYHKAHPQYSGSWRIWKHSTRPRRDFLTYFTLTSETAKCLQNFDLSHNRHLCYCCRVSGLWIEAEVEGRACVFLTGVSAVEIGIAVVPVELRGDGRSVCHQQEDEAHPRQLAAGERFAHCHLQKVNIPLITYLDFVFEPKKKRKRNQHPTVIMVKIQWLETASRPPPPPSALTSIREAAPPVFQSPNPSYPASLDSCLPRTLCCSTPFKLRSPVSPAHSNPPLPPPLTAPPTFFFFGYVLFFLFFFTYSCSPVSNRFPH